MSGNISPVFAIDFSQAFAQTQKRTLNIKDIFGWSATVTNLYAQSLKLVKDQEVLATATAFDEMMNYYDTCPRIQHEDFIHILFETNPSFVTTFLYIFDETTPLVLVPTGEAISQSYKKFFACKKISHPLAPDYAALNNEINRIYYELYIDGYRKQTINHDNFWSDFFWNGSLDDSDFDILHDIAQIGKILFEQFQESPEILFYRLPSVVGGGIGGIWGNGGIGGNRGNGGIGGNAEIGGIGGNGGNGEIGGNAEIGGNGGNGGNGFDSELPLSPSTIVLDIEEDSSVQDFILSTREVSPSSSVGALLLGNQCLTEDVIDIVEEEAPEPIMTPEEYIAAINHFIDNANTNAVVLEALKEKSKQTLLDAPNIPDPSDPGYSAAVANLYAEQAFGDAPLGTCEYACNALPLIEQTTCQMKCAKSCIQQCDGLSLQDKALCVSDCICFLVSWPTGPGWALVEDMYRIKFCKVPVQNKKVERRTKLYSIQAIFQEIADVLQWLRDSGQMVKFSEKKEFLDGSIKINFPDTFAFQLQIGFKPLFPQRSKVIEERNRVEHNTNLWLGILNMNTADVGADDYEKYIVVADVSRNKAMMEPVNSLVDIDRNIQKFVEARQNIINNNIVSPSLLKTITAGYVQETNMLFVQNMIDFLQDNQFFWYTMTDELWDITKMALELQAKIQMSK